MLANYTVEIIPNAPKLLSEVIDGVVMDAPAADDPIFHPKPPVDVTDRVLLDRIGSVNRSVERDLLSFRTGDLTLTLDDHDGYLADLFALFGTSDRWQLRVIRNKRSVFLGVIIGVGSLFFNDREKTLEMTAFGPSRILDDATAEIVRREVVTLYPTSGHSSGVRTLSCNDTSTLLADDTIRIHEGEEEFQTVDIQRIISSVQFKLKEATVFAVTGTAGVSTNPICLLELKTPYHRFKTVEYLVKALFGAAGIPLVEYSVTASKLLGVAPYPINRSGLPDNNVQISPANEQGGVTYITIDGNGTYKQSDPEDDWTQSDSSDRIWVDWSRYRTTEPSVQLRDPSGIKDDIFADEWIHGWDFENSPYSMYLLQNDGVTDRLRKRTSADGVTWGAVADVAALPDEALGDLPTGGSRGCEYDPVRDGVYCWYVLDSGNLESHFYDISGATFTQELEADDVTDGTAYFGHTYVPEKDYVLALRSNLGTGPTFKIAAWRGTTRLWVRDFPRCLIRSESGEHFHYPTRTIRYMNGVLCGTLSRDGDLKFFWTDDEFVTLNVGSLGVNSIVSRIPTGLVNGRLRIFASEVAAPTSDMNLHWFVAESTARLRPAYADFTDQTVAEALSDLATLVNATYWVDDDLQGHFVARDLVPGGTEHEIGDLVLDQTSVRHWDEVKDQVTVTGTGIEAIAGSASAASESVQIQNSLVPNEAFALAIAKGAADFFSKDRRMTEVTLDNKDARIYHQMQRVLLHGVRWLVYESEHDLISDETRLTLLEDV